MRMPGTGEIEDLGVFIICVGAAWMCVSVCFCVVPQEGHNSGKLSNFQDLKSQS